MGRREGAALASLAALISVWLLALACSWLRVLVRALVIALVVVQA